jgi:hypothetical protein
VCDNIINTILDIGRKSKDNLNARLDLQPILFTPGTLFNESCTKEIVLSSIKRGQVS